MKNKKISKTSKKVTTPLSMTPSSPQLESSDLDGEDLPQDPVPSLFTHEKLLVALYWVLDFMDRSLMDFFLVGKTADAVKQNIDLYGDKITVAVRKTAWESGSRRIADSFAPPLKDNGETVEYEYAGVPIVLYVLVDSEATASLDQKIYHSEFFKLPNPYDQFFEEYPWLR